MRLIFASMPSPAGRVGLAAALVALLAGCAPRRPDIETVLTGVTVVTLDSTQPGGTALAVGGGRIIAVGNADSVLGWKAGLAPLADLGGAIIAPAFVDHHIHLYNVGLALLNSALKEQVFLDLSGARSIQEIANRVKARADSSPAGTWITGAGWSQGSWGTQALPTLAEISAAAPNHPVFLARADGHAGWVNARALALAGISKTTRDPEGGTIGHLAKGDPSGILLERANDVMMALLPPTSDDDVMAAYRIAADTMAARGVVEVDDAGPLPSPGVVALDADLGRYLALLRRADSTAPFPIRINLMVPAPSRLADSLLAGGDAAFILSPRIRVTHLKLFADGALGSRGAALTHRYADDSTTRGVARMTADTIAALARRALDRGLGVATHAIGDEAVRRTLDAYERILAEQPALDRHRLRIEHFSYARDEDFARAVRLGVVLSVQSDFNAAPDERPGLGGMRVGEPNEARVYAWDRLYRAGAVLVEGSDYFTEPGPAMAPFLATLARKYAAGSSRPDAIGRQLAWRLNALRVPPTGVGHDGVLRAGGPADFMVLDRNPFSGPRTAIERIRVRATFHDGQAVIADSSIRRALARP